MMKREHGAFALIVTIFAMYGVCLAALLALAVVLCGVAIGLGSERFWWVVERACLGLVALFLSGVQAGEWIGDKIRRRETR